MAIASVNPATGEKLREFAPLGEAELEEKLERAERAFQAHRRTSFAERAERMQRAADILETEKDRLARLMTEEMGKPIRGAREEAAKCALVCRYYAEHAERFLADEVVETSASRSFVHYEPLGAVLAVMPWNFPFWQVFRFAAPALMAGNTGLLKHASNVPQCALAIEEIFLRAGFAEGVFQTLLLNSDKVARVIDDPRVRAATLTGSEHAGSEVASRAGREIKKTVLELGGSDPFIVMPGADFESAVSTAVKARTINNGQSCIAAKRFIVHAEIYEEFARRFVAAMKALKVGDPLDETTDIGPLATESIVAELEEQVRKSVELGARVLTGGARLPRAGNYYAPTVLAEIPKNSPAYTEEFFGPVALLFRADSIDEAIRLANDTTFGLGASAWTRDAGERERFIGEIEAGAVFINSMVASDPRMPFGGVKRSGYGRELGAHGIREFVNIKTVWIKDDDEGGERRTETE
ncbi:MAG TPA: NAD-dependent succinate-semialdehyde dehydrogenase [Pyrinomonadaceae bacterium]|jgi:succinate-semialdehyde dehydrogenase/glutarate-semialdehyde dehydrogenase|nr:NAD-dependent succinate-semialdehyde dehydrogenase [Pyrinomonadaceae bacterium]